MMRRGLIGFPIALLALAALAVFQDTLGVSLFYVTVLATLFFWVAQATSWNILSGYSGYFSFGQGAFVGVGVYTTAVLTSKHGWDFYLTLPVAVVLSTLLALGIGAVAFRVGAFRGATFALLTLAVPFILASVARLSSRIDGGQGVSVPGAEVPEPLRFQQFLYLVMLVIAIVAVAAAYAIQYSRFGWALAAIRDNEDVAEALGVATYKWKMLAIAVTGAIAGVGGSAWALQFGFVQVEVVFGLTVPLFVIVMSVLGGRTYWLGPVLGATVIVLVQDRLAGGGFESWRPIIFGTLLAVTVIFAPEGLWAQLKARPMLTGVTGAVALLVLFIAGVGDVLDRIVLAMLAAGVAAFWPRRFLPARLRPSPAAQSAPSVRDVPATRTTTPEPEADEAAVPSNGVSLPPADRDAPVAIECRGLARHFGGVRALDGLDLRIRQGELVGLIGPNGSGKTTLVNLLSGAVRPTRGSIHIADREVTRLAPHA